jgi:2'-5' RNA ligase
MDAGRAGNWFVGWPVVVPAGWIESIRAGAPESLRWFAERDLHVTLAFLGRFRTDRFDAVAALLDAIPPLPEVVTLGSLRLLPNSRRFSAISFELDSGRSAVSDIIECHRSDVLAAAGATPDDRPPLAHVTIARPPRRATARVRREVSRWAAAAGGRGVAVQLGPPAIFAWARDRSTSQFEIIFRAPAAQYL